jgi:hypothetical protein
MDATAFTDRSNRKRKACKKEESIYGLSRFTFELEYFLLQRIDLFFLTRKQFQQHID